MQNVRFENIVIIGCGKIAVTVLKYVLSLKERYGFALNFIQHEAQELTAVHKVCSENEIPLFAIPDKKAMAEKLLEYKGNTLVISAGNYYIFPKELLKKENIVVINFHNALLPLYPGRNAPSWAIYYDEKVSGATWHMVTEKVDEGGIIWQKGCEITTDMKAYELTAAIMELAQEGIEEFLEKLLQGDVKTIPQEDTLNRKMYYAKEIPGEGMVNISENPVSIYRTLRAMDYGKMGPFPNPILTLADGERVEILRYKKVQKAVWEGQTAENSLTLPLDEEHLLLLKYKKKEN